MVNYGFTFNGKHSLNDIGVSMEYKKILPPPKKKLKSDVPYMNGMYDFSTVGSMNEQVFGQRIIEIKLNLFAKNKTKEQLQNLYDEVCDWLMDCNKSQLIFDDKLGFYFLAEVEAVTSFDETCYWGYMVFNFTCDPFKYGVDLYGELQWDNIDFNLPDYIESTAFIVAGSKTITIYVPGNRVITPCIICGSVMSCTLNNYTAQFSTVVTTNWDFRLQPGANIIAITGNGNIEFNFRKEVL